MSVNRSHSARSHFDKGRPCYDEKNWKSSNSVPSMDFTSMDEEASNSTGRSTSSETNTTPRIVDFEMKPINTPNLELKQTKRAAILYNIRRYAKVDISKSGLTPALAGDSDQFLKDSLDQNESIIHFFRGIVVQRATSSAEAGPEEDDDIQRDEKFYLQYDCNLYE